MFLYHPDHAPAGQMFDAGAVQTATAGGWVDDPAKFPARTLPARQQHAAQPSNAPQRAARGRTSHPRGTTRGGAPPKAAKAAKKAKKAHPRHGKETR